MLRRLLAAIERRLIWSGLLAVWLWHSGLLRLSLRTTEREALVGRARCRLFGGGRARYQSVRELQAHGAELFEHAGDESSGLHDVMVVDDFYDDPDNIRKFALGLEYVPYLNYPDRFGCNYRKPGVLGAQPFWFCSALEIRPNPLRGRGTRLADATIRERLAGLVKAEVDEQTWPISGDGWNGAFHYKIRGSMPFATSMIHNHVGRDTDVIDGWSGIVYLTPDTTAAGRGKSGTSIWRDRRTGRCYSTDSVYNSRFEDYELAHVVENRYNRLVLLRASVLHMGEEGFGTRRDNARLFQTFFFNVRPTPTPGNG